MKKPIKKILVGVDGSESSRKALESALDLAEASDAKVTLLEVKEFHPPLPTFYGDMPLGWEPPPKMAELDLQKFYPAIKETKVVWDRKVVEGHAPDKICEEAKEGNYDLVVVGTTGLSGVGRFLMGSVSDRVVHHAPCSVEVVR